MSKVKINLASGNVVEKPLVTCFKGTNGSYLVLDNETNGSMGLPIICISKLNGTVAEKIFDQNEWGSVKENLKTIIAGTALPYLNVPELLTAQDDFFTQLTLPVASFDLLKSVYAPAAPEAPAAPVVEEIQQPAPAAPEVAPVAPAIPDPTPISAPEAIAPAPVMPIQTAPVIDAPMISPLPQAAPAAPAPVAEPIAPVIAAPTIEPTPIASPVAAPAVNPNDIAAIKENFMKSCENMFDALIKKFENK